MLADFIGCSQKMSKFEFIASFCSPPVSTTFPLKELGWNNFLMKWEQYFLFLFHFVFCIFFLYKESCMRLIYGAMPMHIGLIMHNLCKNVGINWIFESMPVLLISSDSCHKNMLVEPLNIPLNNKKLKHKSL